MKRRAFLAAIAGAALAPGAPGLTDRYGKPLRVQLSRFRIPHAGVNALRVGDKIVASRYAAKGTCIETIVYDTTWTVIGNVIG